ncbi:MAG: hypothetical protein AAGJ46_14955 [Planctomycetota bacterium]
MELNRNQYFFAGVLLVLLGVQFRLVSTFVLTPEAAQLLAKKPAAVATETATPAAFGVPEKPAFVPSARREIRPPEWLGWCLMSVGAVLVLHSLSMKKPD